MSYQSAIESLKAEIAENKKVIAEKEFVLSKLMAWTKGKMIQPTGVIDRQTIELPEAPPATQPLADQIRDVIGKLGGKEFQVNQIEMILESTGRKVPGKYPRARISSELSDLVARGEIIRTFEGKGSTPHRYQQQIGGLAGTAPSETNA